MNKNKFILFSNQRCGSTWFITSVGNCNNVITDYEIKWSKNNLSGKPSPYHLFLDEIKIDNIFNNFKISQVEKIYGTKFVFDFYKAFPAKNYLTFLDSFLEYKIIHLQRDYLDILKSKLLGRVSHLLDINQSKKSRLIDVTILKKQSDYLNIQKNFKESSKKINFVAAKSYLINLFINDVLILSLRKKNYFLNIKYSEIKDKILAISDFLNLPVEDLKINFFEKPTILKNNLNYGDNFENYLDLQKLNLKLKNKINDLINMDFDFNEVIFFDISSKKVKINIM